MLASKTWIVLALVVLSAGAVQAVDDKGPGIGFSRATLERASFTAGQVAFDIYAEGRVDVGALVADIDLEKSIAPHSLVDRVNDVRQALYPEEEIILAITPSTGGRAAEAGEKVTLVRMIAWWNNSNCSTCYWYAQYNSTVAILVVDDVQRGSFKIYDRTGSGNWVYRNTVFTGGGLTRTSYGSYMLRGFKGSANNVTSKADIIMYFFR